MANININGPVVSELDDLRDVDFITASPSLDDNLSFDGTNWVPTVPQTIPVDSVNGHIGIVVLDKTDIGLTNVDNTSDLSKPVSTATQIELNLKANIADTDTSAEVDAKIAALVDSSPATLDTLNELAAAIGDDANFSTTISNNIALKESITNVDTLKGIGWTIESVKGNADDIGTNVTAIGLNTAKTGITSQQATDIITNNAKISADAQATNQGNTFNGISQLVQTTVDGKLPILDGSNLTNLPSGATNLDGLSDVVITTPSDNQFLRHTGTGWVNETVTIPAPAPVDSVNGNTGTVVLDLDDMNNVTITTPATDQVISYNGSGWINSTPAVGGGAEYEWEYLGSQSTTSTVVEIDTFMTLNDYDYKVVLHTTGDANTDPSAGYFRFSDGGAIISSSYYNNMREGLQSTSSTTNFSKLAFTDLRRDQGNILIFADLASQSSDHDTSVYTEFIMSGTRRTDRATTDQGYGVILTGTSFAINTLDDLGVTGSPYVAMGQVQFSGNFVPGLSSQRVDGIYITSALTSNPRTIIYIYRCKKNQTDTELI